MRFFHRWVVAVGLALFGALAVVAALGGCSQGSERLRSALPSAVPDVPSMAPPASLPPTQEPPERKLVKTATMVVLAGDISQAVTRARSIAVQAGGFILVVSYFPMQDGPDRCCGPFFHTRKPGDACGLLEPVRGRS